MNALTMLTATSVSPDMGNSSAYLAGAIIALLILGYLLYTLINPEKF